MTLGKIIKYVVAWEIAIILVTSISGLFFPLRPMFLGGRDHANPVNPDPYSANPLLYSRANFDGIHYVEMARRGYDNLQQAFFPMYSTLIRFLTPYFGNSTMGAIIVSTLSFIFGLYFLHKLIKLDYSDNIANLVIVLLLVFPVSFFFTFVYTEGLFFLLVVGSFYASRKRRWLLAGILGGLASYTRFVGILLFPALILEWWTSKSKIKDLLPIFLVPIGLLVYMRFLLKTTGDPLAFIHVQKYFYQGRGDKIILLYQVFWRYIKMVATVDHTNPIYPTVLLEFATGIVFTILSVLTFFKTRISYSFFAIASFVIPTLTGTFTSLPRFMLISFPALIVLAMGINKLNKPTRIAILTLSAIIQSIFLAMFVRGYWVS